MSQNNTQQSGSLNQNFEVGIVNNVLRTLGENSSNQRNYRRQLTQQRTFGFMVNDKESLEILNQGIKTIQDILDSRSDGLEPFSYEHRELVIGQWVDVKDTIDHWLEAEVIDVDPQERKVLVHYNEWSSRWDEWLSMSSKRIAPFRSQTVQNGYSFFMSPAPEKNLDGDINTTSPGQLPLGDAIVKIVG